MEIGARVYYDKATGNVVINTGERSGNVVHTTIEQDFTVYATLAQRVPETVGALQLDYGEYQQDFAECDGYRVDISGAMPTLIFSYPDPNLPSEPPVYQPPLTEQVATLKAKLSKAEQSAADNSLTTQQLIETLFDLGVI